MLEIFAFIYSDQNYLIMAFASCKRANKVALMQSTVMSHAVVLQSLQTLHWGDYRELLSSQFLHISGCISSVFSNVLKILIGRLDNHLLE